MTPPALPITRRRLLRQTFAFSAAALLGSGCRSFVKAAPESAADDLHLLMIGDWGEDSRPPKKQQAVAAGMARYAQEFKLNPQAMLLLGDNFYGPFKGGTGCPRWKTQFEDMYPRSVFDCPCYAMLGNHDYDDEPVAKLRAELDYAKENKDTRWTLPAKWYAFDFPAKNPLVKFITLDSNYQNSKVSLTDEERTAQNAWFKKEIAAPRRAPYLIVMAHHPLYSNGAHGDQKQLIADWEPLLREHQAHFYFSGHDHDLQHIEFQQHPTSFIVSGGGGARVRPWETMRHPPFGQAVHGFSHLQVNKDRLIVRHLDANRNQIHAVSKTPAGKVSILA